MKFRSIYLIGLATISFAKVVDAKLSNFGNQCSDNPGLDWEVTLVPAKITSSCA